jgi:2-oxoglutarate dehydrogenase E2 component (dihydrolipoamide succinyltransferase)
MSERVPVRIPKVSMSTTEAAFVTWLVKDGTQVEQGDSIYSVETEKVEVDVESPATGTLRHGNAEADEVYAVGTEVGHIEPAS